MTRNGLDDSSDRKYYGLGKCEKMECIIWVNVIDFAFSHGFGPKLAPNWAFWGIWSPKMTLCGLDNSHGQRYHGLVPYQGVSELEMNYSSEYCHFCLFFLYFGTKLAASWHLCPANPYIFKNLGKMCFFRHLYMKTQPKNH